MRWAASGKELTQAFVTALWRALNGLTRSTKVSSTQRGCSKHRNGTDRRIVGEFIGAERGIGRLVIGSEAWRETLGMMVAVIVLMPIGVILSAGIWRLQAYLLRWRRPHMVG